MMRKELTEELRQLEEELLALGSLVEGMLIEAADLLRGSDLDGLERLGDTEQQVHRKRLTVEMGSLSLIATHRPPEGELHALVALVEIAAQLERMADHSRRVARANYPTADRQLRRPLADLRRLAEEVQLLLDGALAAFVEREGNSARALASGTRELESLYQVVRRDLLALIRSKPRIANQAIFIMRSAYHLWRAAERIVEICDWVVFAVEGSLAACAPVDGIPVHLTGTTSIAA
jgi:phosphate transport system protein